MEQILKALTIAFILFIAPFLLTKLTFEYGLYLFNTGNDISGFLLMYLSFFIPLFYYLGLFNLEDSTDE